jgi:hypothetical protein
MTKIRFIPVLNCLIERDGTSHAVAIQYDEEYRPLGILNVEDKPPSRECQKNCYHHSSGVPTVVKFKYSKDPTLEGDKYVGIRIECDGADCERRH